MGQQQIFDHVSNTLTSFGADGSGLVYTLQRQLAAVRTRADDVANWPNVSPRRLTSPKS